MIEKIVTSGCFPDVTANGGRFWMIARLGDPQVAGAVAMYTWEEDVTKIREIWREALPPQSPCFPRIHVFRGLLWFGFHDGTKGHLRNASTSFMNPLDPCQGNDPICFGFGWAAWQGAATAGYPITRLDLATGETVAAGAGSPTGLSRITEDGTVILVDDDRTRIPGGTRPCWAWDLVVIEKHGNKGALARLTDGRELTFWDTVQIITPRNTYDPLPSSQTYAVAAHASDDGMLRVATLTADDFPPLQPEPDPMPIPNRKEFVRAFLAPHLKIVGSINDTRAHTFEQVNALVLELRKTDAKWGVLEKTSGDRVRDRSADIAAYRLSATETGIVDVVSNAEGAPRSGETTRRPPEPYWEIKQSTNGSRWKEPFGAVPDEPDEPDPDEPDEPDQPDPDRLARIEAAVLRMEAKLNQVFR